METSFWPNFRMNPTGVVAKNDNISLPDAQKVDKLISRTLALVEKVRVDCEGNLALQRSIDQYLLIQNAVELKLMFEAFQMMRIDGQKIQSHYRQVYFRWREGVRTLHAHSLNSMRNW